MNRITLSITDSLYLERKHVYRKYQYGILISSQKKSDFILDEEIDHSQ